MTPGRQFLARSGIACAIVLGGLIGCASQRPPLEPVDSVDLDRFMGQWYVIANIPTFIEEHAYNAVEIYERNDDGTIATTFRFRDGGFDEEVVEFTPKGFVRDGGSNAVWGMQFIWPVKADYRIVYLNDEYTRTIVGRNQRDYVWLMARSPSIPEADYQALLAEIDAMGYDTGEIRKVPQAW